MFAYSLGDRLAGEAAKLLRLIRSTYAAFRARVDEVMILHKHDCQA